MKIPVSFKIDKSKKILILWSGGYDSTLILIEALRQGYDVETLYIDLENNHLKSIREIYKRQLIHQKLENKFSKVIKDRVIKILNIKRPLSTYMQPSLWLTQSLITLEKDVDYICLGYLKYSSFWHIHDQWRIAFKTLQKCLILDKEILPLFPLEWVDKEDCHKYFKKYYSKIYSLCHTCETPVLKNSVIVDCGECKSCKNLKQINDFEVDKPEEIIESKRCSI